MNVKLFFFVCFFADADMEYLKWKMNSMLDAFNYTFTFARLTSCKTILSVLCILDLQNLVASPTNNVLHETNHCTVTIQHIRLAKRTLRSTVNNIDVQIMFPSRKILHVFLNSIHRDIPVCQLKVIQTVK